VVKRLKPLPIEAVARGYLIGSGWKDYQASGAVCGIALPAGLRQAEQLPQPLFTPSTKAEQGTHDENIDFASVERMIGAALAAQVRDATLRLYREAAAHARVRGIIIADTKFEFGLDAAGKLYLIDEVLTPDSSRFWPADLYQVGISPAQFRQAVRAGLSGNPGLEQESARGPETAAGYPRQDCREVPRGINAADRPNLILACNESTAGFLRPAALRCDRTRTCRTGHRRVAGRESRLGGTGSRHPLRRRPGAVSSHP